MIFLLIFLFAASSIQTVANSIDDVAKEIRRENDMREFGMRNAMGYEPPAPDVRNYEQK